MPQRRESVGVTGDRRARASPDADLAGARPRRPTPRRFARREAAIEQHMAARGF
jgi:hypothetical protein